MMRAVHVVAFILIVVGAVNWGLVGLFRLNLVESLFSFVPGLTTFLYIMVGMSGVYIGVTHVKDCKECLGLKKR